LLASWNVTVRGADTLQERAENESAISAKYVAVSHTSSIITGDDLFDTGNASVTLTNGSSHGTATLYYKNWYSDTDAGWGPNGGKGTTASAHMDKALPVYQDGSGDAYEKVRVYVEPPTQDHSQVTVINIRTFHDRWNRIEDQNDALQSEVDVFVNNTWGAYDSGQINSSDVLSRDTQMFRYGAEASNGSDLYTTVAALSQMGLDTPEPNGTGTMTVVYDNVEYHGLVMAREAPNGTWESNTTYNGSAIDGPVFLATTDGRQIDLDGEFRISSISSTDGSSIQNVTATKVVYKTSNTSELLEKMDQISELRKQVEAKQQSAGGGGSGSPIDPKYLLGALAIIGVLAYSQGQKRGD